MLYVLSAKLLEDQLENGSTQHSNSGASCIQSVFCSWRLVGGAKEPGLMYFPTNWGAKEPQNLPNHRAAKTNISPKNKWLEDDPFLLGRFDLFSGANC